MICQINFSTYESNPCWELQEVLNIEASTTEVNEIYRSISKKPLGILFDTPRLRSLERYDLFLQELKNRKIKFSKVEPCALIF